MKCVPQTVSKCFLKEGETDGKASYVPRPSLGALRFYLHMGHKWDIGMFFRTGWHLSPK